MTQELEPLAPDRAIELYEQERTDELSPRTLRTHLTRLGHFLRWTEAVGLDNMNDLTGRKLHEYRIWRKDDANSMAKATIRSEMSDIRQLIKFCERIDAVDPGLHDKIVLPSLDQGEGIRDDSIEPERMERVLTHLDRFEHASHKHVVLLLLWETACRIGALRSLDVEHFDPKKQAIEFEHRPDIDLPLKNGPDSERFVALNEETTQTVSNWIEHQRPDVTDEFGNNPLIASEYGRATISGLRGLIYYHTRSCLLAECTCEEQFNYDNASRCEQSVGPHALRRSALTHWLRSDEQGGAGIPKQIASDRADVSPEVLDEHYSQLTKSEQMERRRGYLDNI